MRRGLKPLLPYIALWYLLGTAYMAIEGVWRGWTHISMLAVGGICGLAIGAINQIPRFYKLRIAWQALIGTAAVLLIEFAAGCILNLWLEMGIWDYSESPGNLLGQICLLYAFLWYLLMPFAIWAEDRCRWVIYSYYTIKGELLEAPALADYTVGSVYRDLFTGR